MPKTLNQHQIRQRAVQTLFSYDVQAQMAATVIREFQENVEKFNIALTYPVRFEIDYKDARITVRKFSKYIAEPLSALTEIYEILNLEKEGQTALAKAMIFMRDFGSYTKKMNDRDAETLYKGIFANLKLIKLFQIDLDDDEAPVATKVLSFLQALPKKASAAETHEIFKQTFSILHENVLEKYPIDLFEPLTLPEELAEKLAQAERESQAQKAELLSRTEDFVLNYDNETDEPLEVPDYFTTLVNGVLEKNESLQVTLSNYLAKGWSFSRLTIVEQAILRVAAFEILFTDTPDLVAVNEAVELSKDFSDEKSSKFVNGVLTNLVKK